MSFDYLLDKIEQAEFASAPFRHISITDFFSEEHLQEITQANEINATGLKSDKQLFDTLFSHGYKIIDFPGCITDQDKYMAWHRSRSTSQITNTACEGFGITLRLMEARSPIIVSLKEFLNGPAFQEALAKKFGIAQADVFYDCGIQKYLDGYEISPHPDIRRKALTYMVNINAKGAEHRDHHTHYLKFRDEFKYVQAFWEGNKKTERCWVPWDWCNTEEMQRENNSIVIFSPSNDTIHGVKASYDHLSGQRTQLYGNLWYHAAEIESSPQWEDLVLGGARAAAVVSAKSVIKSLVPKTIRDKIGAVRSGTPDPAVVRRAGV